ncbi:hypothetical protein ACQR1N_30945 [Bradyrhizobium sp. HKCCYLRH1073]|uniref:hypothetical protein n=1 Tax=unclassified Bradyrhizobium TaxID=2631580 RepID=UPI003EBBBEF5
MTLWLPVSAVAKIDHLVEKNPRLFRDRSEFIRDVVMAAAARSVDDLANEKLKSLASSDVPNSSSAPGLPTFEFFQLGDDEVLRAPPQYWAELNSIYSDIAKLWMSNRSAVESALLAENDSSDFGALISAFRDSKSHADIVACLDRAGPTMERRLLSTLKRNSPELKKQAAALEERSRQNGMLLRVYVLKETGRPAIEETSISSVKVAAKK